jgi:hypothetical protein
LSRQLSQVEIDAVFQGLRDRKRGMLLGGSGKTSPPMQRGASLTLEGRLAGPTLTVEDLLTLDEGHRFTGRIVASGKKRGILVDTLAPLGFQGKISEDIGRGGVVPPP